MKLLNYYNHRLPSLGGVLVLASPVISSLSMDDSDERDESASLRRLLCSLSRESRSRWLIDSRYSRERAAVLSSVDLYESASVNTSLSVFFAADATKLERNFSAVCGLQSAARASSEAVHFSSIAMDANLCSVN